MKMYSVIRALSPALLLAGAALTAQAASFSAEMLDTKAGQTRTGPFHFQEKSYRFETVEGGQTLIVTGDGASGVTRLLVPSDKVYVEAGPDEPMSRMMSPFAFFAHYARTYEVRAEGTETIGGVPCTKRVAFTGEQVFATAWFSDEYDFPLKVEVPILDRTIELRDIRPGPQDTALFAVPADYKPAPGPGEEPPPEWAAQVPGAPVMTPPFERALAEGEIIRLRPQAGRHIRVQGTNKKQEDCGFTGIGFKDGRPLGDPGMSTVNLSPDQEVSMTFTDTPAEADELVIRVRNGTVTIKAEWLVAPGAAADEPASPAPATPLSPPPAPELSAEVDAPDSADMASRFEVRWNGPANNDDYISVARPGQPPGSHVSLTRVREGNPLKIWAPSDPGEYEVRYIVARGAKLLAKTPITIHAVTATVEVAGPVKAAAWIEARWDGPGADDDFVSVARRGQPPGASVARTAVKQGNPVRVRAPSDPGDYEVRYVLARGAKLLASAVVKVEPVTATVEAPATVTAATDFDVRWSGPDYPEDRIVIARQNQAAAGNIGSKPTRTGNPVKLRAPREPGTYEVRYLLGHGNRLLATTTITVAAP